MSSVKLFEEGAGGSIYIYASNNTHIDFRIKQGDSETSVTLEYEQIPQIIKLLKKGFWDYENTCFCSAWNDSECACGNYGNTKIYPE